jgi:hypothetical protein
MPSLTITDFGLEMARASARRMVAAASRLTAKKSLTRFADTHEIAR